MKCLTVSILMMLSFIRISAQVTDSSKVSPTEVLMNVDKMPEFPGGMSAMSKFLSGNIVYPSTARDQGIEGKVYASFTIDKEGTPSDFKIDKGIDAECDKEVLRVLQLMPKWIPGELNGKRVAVRFRLPVNFKFK